MLKGETTDVNMVNIYKYLVQINILQTNNVRGSFSKSDRSVEEGGLRDTSRAGQDEGFTTNRERKGLEIVFMRYCTVCKKLRHILGWIGAFINQPALST